MNQPNFRAVLDAIREERRREAEAPPPRWSVEVVGPRVRVQFLARGTTIGDAVDEALDMIEADEWTDDTAITVRQSAVWTEWQKKERGE